MRLSDAGLSVVSGCSEGYMYARTHTHTHTHTAGGTQASTTRVQKAMAEVLFASASLIATPASLFRVKFRVQFRV